MCVSINGPRDLDLWPLGGLGSCGWGGSSSSIRSPSLKFVGLGIRKIWRTMCVNINGSGDPDLRLFDLKTGMRVASKVGNLTSKFGHARPLGSRIIRSVRNRRTDKSNAYCPLPYGRGHNNAFYGSKSRCMSTDNFWQLLHCVVLNSDSVLQYDNLWYEEAQIG